MTIRPLPSEFFYAESGADSTGRFAPILEAFLTGRGDASDDIERELARDPECVFGHCLRAAIIVRGDDAASRSRLLQSIAAIESLSLHVNHYAHRHASAARAWLEGNQVLAVERYGAIVVDFPRDLVALVVAHALDFRFGLRRMLRDRIAQVLPEWHAAIPGYASVLAMYAFGLEENGEYRRAEKIAYRALKVDPRHPAAMHVVAHVMEMQGRSQEGLKFLAATESAWLETSFSVHLAWHRALFHLDDDDARSALEVYDTHIARPHAISELADASALLWRLHLRNVPLGGRWQRLADRWDLQALGGARPFYVAHATIAFAAADRPAAAQRILDRLQHRTASRALISPLEDEPIVPICKAIVLFAHGDYAGCVGWLERVRHVADRCGGSLAQCDLVQLTFVEAALRANKANLARALVAERTAQNPSSRLNRRLQRRVA
jgi:tetratricopeptide (TPR) repeat protein